jgi:hypothetical protein
LSILISYQSKPFAFEHGLQNQEYLPIPMSARPKH